MERSPQVNLSSAMKTSFVSFAALFLVLSAFGASAFAVPIAVDQYQDMENGTAGNQLTAAIMNASSHGSGGWSAPSGSMWVSTLYHRDLPGPVIVGGTTYNGTGGSRSWMFNNNNMLNYVRWNAAGYSDITVACFYTTLTTLTYTVGYDTIIMWGGSYSCMQTLGVSSAGTRWGPLIRQHSCLEGNLTCATGGSIYLTPGKTYWLNMKYDNIVGLVILAAFDPDNSYAQSGTTIYVESRYGQLQGNISDFGRGDAHGNTTNDTTQSYFDHIIFDYTNAAFPLLLCGPNDSTVPTAPPVVRDGTGHDQDQTLALSGTQLSANWDLAWDAESGVKGYQYAIGTTTGGTNIVNWTTLKNQLGVTKTGLSLTNGQTYYFAVRAINGVGLTGPTTNSGGQTYGPTDTTPPGAPTVVRDGWYIQGTPDTDYGSASYANFDPASDPESGISFYQYAIGTTPGGNDSVNWTFIPGNSREVFGATIPSPVGGTRYYTSVRAVNNVGLTGPATSSDGVVYPTGSDSTNPGAPPAVRDGTGSDISIQTSTAQLSANWDKGSDPDTGIMCYYYRIGTTPGGNNILNDTPSNINYYPVTNMTATGLSLSVGQTYYIGVKSINSKWMSSSWANSNGVTVVSSSDTTPPSAPPAVRDGTGTDISTTVSTTQLSANWDAGTDNDTGISGYQYAIGTSAGGTQTVNWTSLGNVTTVTRTGLTLSIGQTYFFSVKAVNGAGLTGNATNSNGQTVATDSTPPSAPPAVRDGTGADISTTISTTQLSANWDASTDNESGISGYQYAIGTSPGGTQTVNWTSLGNVTTVTKTGLTLNVGQTYFFSVQAVNGVGLTGSATNSNGQTIITDTTPPSAPANVRDGTGVDISTTTSTTQLSANWDASTDNESGISGYQYAIGTTAGGTQTVNWTSLGNVMTVTKTGLTLSVGQTYYFSVQAVNGVGLTSSAANSNGQTIVPTIPVMYFQDNFENWTVHGGTWSSVSNESATHTLNTSTDYARLGSKSLKITDSDTTATTGASLRKDFSPAISGDIYVRFYLFLPTGFAASSSGTARRVLRVYCPGGSNNWYSVITLSTNSLSMAEVGGWSGTGGTSISENAWHCVELHVSPPSSSTPMQYWVDGTSAGTCTGAYSGSSTFTYMLLGDVGLASSGTTNGTGTFYWDEVVVSNVYIGPLDSTPPTAPPAVRDGTGVDISTTSSTTQLLANWDASTDAETGISGYQYAIGTTAGGTQTVNWTSLGNVTTVTRTGLSLVAGQTYFFSVQAVNGAGLTGAATNSNGQTVQGTDVTPPSAPANVRDGVGADISTTSSTTQLSANWDASTDAESGISGYQYAIGTTAGGTQILNWTSLGNVTTMTQTGLSYVVGQTYYVSVGAVNGAALTGSAANSNGQTVVDITPPTVTSTVVNGANGAGTQRSMVKSLVVTFSKIATLDTGAFTIVNKATLAPVTAAVSADSSSGKTIATLTFSGNQTQYGSLIDGNYQLTIDATKVHDSTTGLNLDGDKDGQSGGNYVFGDVTTDKFFRLGGDGNGSRGVDGTDFLMFSGTMGKSSTDAGFLWYFDYNNSNHVDGTDFLNFSHQMNKTMNFQ